MRLLAAHPKKISREVKPEDFATLNAIQKEWQELCHQPIGKAPGAFAIAHVQVNAVDPLRAFITADGRIVFNPVILDKELPFTNQEACMTWPFRGLKKVQRFERVYVEYYVLENGKPDILPTVEWLDGLYACIFQHEIGHFDLNTIYPIK